MHRRAQKIQPDDRVVEFIGKDPKTRQLNQTINSFAKSPFAILISGETGVGKDLVARKTHLESKRKNGPFVAVNCATLQANLAASLLFGCVKGAFTGAVNKTGYLLNANHGTLFLDEIADLPMPVQTMLLRALENRTFCPVGSHKEQYSDFRLVCASHVDLISACRQGLFRRDLLYRISTLKLEVPPLRERLSNLELIADHLMPGITTRMVTGAVKKLTNYHFPGNVRELKNVLQRATVLRPREPIRPSDIIFDQPSSTEQIEATSLEAQICSFITTAVSRCNGNIRQAARQLEVSPTTVYRYLTLR